MSEKLWSLFIVACRVSRDVEGLILRKRPSYKFWWMNMVLKLSRDNLFYVELEKKGNIGWIIDTQASVA